MRAFTLRPARLIERAELDALCFRSKAHWGYDTIFMEHVRDQIRVNADALADGRTWVAVDGTDTAMGVVEVDPIDATRADLTLLFIDPPHLRKGIGRALFAKALDLSASLGATELLIDSDPQAAAFYAAMGADRIGSEPTGYQGRLLPRFRALVTDREV